MTKGGPTKEDFFEALEGLRTVHYELTRLLSRAVRREMESKGRKHSRDLYRMVFGKVDRQAEEQINEMFFNT